jgi:methyl-accepting chemotaxis protein
VLLFASAAAILTITALSHAGHSLATGLLLQALVLAAAGWIARLAFRRHCAALARITEALQEATEGNLSVVLPSTADPHLYALTVRTHALLGLASEAIGMLRHGAVALATGAKELQEVSTTMSSTAEATAGRATAVSAAAEQVSGSAHRVAAATEEFNATIRDVAVHASEASTVAQEATRQATLTGATVNELSAASERVTQVVDLIGAIARQTHLLALNATLEAARAGDAGRGFAVVASQVKQLAEQTATATGTVNETVRSMQNGAVDVARAINEITTTISQVSENQGAIATAVEEQTATTNEMGRGAAEAANGASDIAHNIVALANAAKATAYAGAQSRTTAAEFATLARAFMTVTEKYRFDSIEGHGADLLSRRLISEAVSDGGVTRIEDTVEGAGFHQFSFHGEWRHSTGNIEADGTNSYSCNVGDTAVLRFRGTQATFFGVADANHGMLACSVDGGPESVVDEYSPTRAAGVRMWTSATLSRGEHTLTVRVTGESNPQSRYMWAAVDRVEISQ